MNGKVEDGKMASEISPLVVNGYSWQMGFVYVFNLILGAGLLTLPKAFSEVGILLGLIALAVLAVMSFITVTFITESMSLANAMWRHKAEQKRKENPTAAETPDLVKAVEKEDGFNIVANPNTESVAELPATDDKDDNAAIPKVTYNDVEKTDFDQLYEITEKAELGEMAQLFFPRVGVFAYYLSICLYLYGSSAVYAAAIAKSMTTVVCDDPTAFTGDTGNKSCHSVPNLTVHNMYQVMMAVFVLVIGPFCYFEIKNTKLLQIFTTTYRWFAMSSMIILAFVKIGRGDGNKDHVNVFNFKSLPSFFGVAVYAFMCQHSIPAVTTPVTNKKRLTFFLIIDFVCVILFYTTILMSAVFAYSQHELQDVYTLNFLHPSFFKYVLQLFPVLTLSATFPVFSIVLRENIKKLILKEGEHHGVWIDRILFSSIAIVPPLIVAFLTSNVGSLVDYTGTYAGAIIQYVVPTMFVFCGRRKMAAIYGEHKNKHRSLFGHPFFVYFVMGWYLVCLIFVTYNKITGTA